MLTWISSKFLPPLLILIFGVVGGIGIQQKVLNPEPHEIIPCPDCHCPEPSVSIQPFEVDKIKNLKAFTYSPAFTGSVHIAGVDSTALQRYVESAVMKAFEKHVKKVDQKRNRK
ncbi:MAG: hypothetical protein ACRC1W_01385 [Shewanella sp.]